MAHLDGAIDHLVRGRDLLQRQPSDFWKDPHRSSQIEISRGRLNGFDDVPPIPARGTRSDRSRKVNIFFISMLVHFCCCSTAHRSATGYLSLCWLAACAPGGLQKL